MSRLPKPIPSQERLSLLFDYSVITGELYWRPRKGCRSDRPAGTAVGSYVQVCIDREPYYAHRVIWALVTGEDPGILDVDHEDMSGSNNAWHNLRLADTFQNMQNVKARENNKTGAKGVVKARNGKYYAQITVRKRRIHLGTFLTVEEASDAYADASKREHGNFGRQS